MATLSDSFLTGANIDFIEALYARFLDNPSNVDASWRDLFSSLSLEGKPLIIDGLVLPPPPKTNGHAPLATAGLSSEAMGLQSKLDQTVFSFRLRGHLLAELDPLKEPRKPLDHVADLGLVSQTHFTEAELNSLVDPQGAFPEPRVPLRRVLERMRKTYCHHIGVEYTHMYDSERRSWLRARMEPNENTTTYSVEDQRRVLRKLTQAETFEATVHTKFQGQKRFSAEGGESQVARWASKRSCSAWPTAAA
jgi:2-oxoglutarate dehydrogenase E1 component